MENLEIRQLIRKYRIRQYEIAELIGISEFTLCRWFRKELDGERRAKVLTAIEAIRAGVADA